MSLTFCGPLHFPCVSRSFVASHFPTSPGVPIGFLVLCVPFIPPALPWFASLSLSCPFQFPLCPFHFPLLSCHVDFPIPPLISLHFLAPQYFPKKSGFYSVFAKRTSKNTEFFQMFGKRRQEAQTSKRAGRGKRAWDPCFVTLAPRRLRLVERHQIAARYVGVPYVSDDPLLGLGVRHAEQCPRISFIRQCVACLRWSRTRTV